MPEHEVLVVYDRVYILRELLERGARERNRVLNNGSLVFERVNQHQEEGEQNVKREENRNDHQNDHAGCLHFHYISTSLLFEMRT